MHLSDIQTVTFDAGGTLIAPWPSVGHVYAGVAERHGLRHLDIDRLNQQFLEAWRGRQNFDYSMESWFALVRRTFQDVAQLPDAFFPEVYCRFSQPDAWQVYDDVLPVLDELATRGFRLGVISNWDERLHPLLNALGLASYFEAIIVSCDVGFAKPSPIIFEQAGRKLGTALAQMLHVGDSRTEDLDGAQAAGCQSVLVRAQEPAHPRECRSLNDLPALL